MQLPLSNQPYMGWFVSEQSCHGKELYDFTLSSQVDAKQIRYLGHLKINYYLKQHQSCTQARETVLSREGLLKFSGRL
jgi:hypothetical protein